ncbi:MAG: SUMF1/EgtB/PvdO family nonheme iron enzyme [Chloroflexota bacterium]|nr:SUMF1/EgtB/PvdO family nonheme iron enzyme [Chloroflexota bacterium]
MRGGSWNNNRRNVRCAYRNRNTPDNFNNNIGFRVVSHDPDEQPVNLVISAMQDGAVNKSQHCPFLVVPSPSSSPLQRGGEQGWG